MFERSRPSHSFQWIKRFWRRAGRRDWGFKLLGHTLVATDKLQRDKPDVLKHFNAAAIQGHRFKHHIPVEVSAIAAKTYSSVLPVETTESQVKQLATFLEQGQPSKPFTGGDEGRQQTLRF